jgi:ATP-dependent exoDNAse (exonuclease V) beta subunit
LKNFVVYKSSAGSGKTFTLVKEYLRLALFDEKKLHYNYKRILAVTFTNKAAAEMKTRVVEALDGIAHAPQMPFVGELLCRELGISPAELKARADLVLSNILHHYSDFSIGTIDSFTHKIVKTFAHDLKLPVNFNIELDTESFYDKVISTLLGQVGEDAYVSRLLKEYVLGKAEDNASWDPESQIREFSKLLQKEHSEGYLEQLKQFNSEELDAFRKQFSDFVHYYKHTLKQEAQKAMDLLKKNSLTDEDFPYKASGPQNFFKKCLNGSVKPEDAHSSRLTEAVSNNKWAGKTSAANAQAIGRITPELNAIALGLIAFIEKNHRYYALCDTLARQMYPLMLLKKIEEISLEKKQDEKLVFISEFNHRIFDIIHNEPTPFIYERLGERYHHYLLDEFQDTSSLQWQNILPLLDNSLSGGWFNLVVGDGKQSIYRWRNANVRQFAALPAVENPEGNVMLEERAQSLSRNFEEKLLDTNFRSLKTIIDFNNSLFDFLSGQLLVSDYQHIYAAQAQKIKHGGAGYITVNTDKVEKDESDALTFRLIHEQISSALNSGFHYKDICILCRKNYHGNLVANYLVGQHIPVVSSDSLLLKNNLEINTILCYLAYLVDNRDQVSAATVLNYLFQSGRIGEADLHRYLAELTTGKSLFDLLRSGGINLREEELSLNNLLDNCIAVIKALRMQEHAYNYIRFFLDEINEFLVVRNSNILSFFDWWQTRSSRASIIIPESTNAVKIMTIHSSKGLEFPVVIVPYCNWALYKANDSWVNIHHEQVNLPVAVINLSEKKARDIGFEKELETETQEQILDNLNLLYVAFTRAVERLHIITVASLTNRRGAVSDWISDFMKLNHAPVRENFYEIGQPTQKQLGENKPGIPSFGLQPLSFDTGANTVQIKAAYLGNTQESEHAKQQGIVMHWILSKIRTADELDAALSSAILEGLVHTREAPGLRTKLAALLAHPKLAFYFRPGVSCKLEAELVTGNKELLRPDRIVFEPGETILIDYKTGSENNAKYFRQMQYYEAALYDMGYPAIKKLLVYVDDASVVDVN